MSTLPPDPSVATVVARVSPRAGTLMRFARNAFHIASGNASAVALGMITLALSAQMLGPALLGILATIEGYGRMVDQIVRLETWQALIRYGADALEKRDGHRFRALVKLGVIMDFLGASLSAAVAFLAVPVAAHWLAWDAATSMMAQIYCIAVLFGVSSTPIGVLRLFDRFAAIAWLDPAIALVRLVGVAIIWVMDGSLWAFLLLGIILQCAQRLLLGWMAWRELRAQGYGDFITASLSRPGERFPGIWGFILAANGTLLIRKSTQEIDLLAVAAITGPAGAGVYHLVRKFTMAATKAGAMMQQVIYPDLARLWARRNFAAFATTIRQVEALTVAFGFALVGVVVLAGEQIIGVIGGSKFEDATNPLIVQSFAALLFLSGSALRPGLASMGLQTKIMPAVIVSAIAFYAVLFTAVPRLGVVGAGFAHIAFNAILLPASAFLFTRSLRRAARDPSPSTG
ncbi:MAG: lipopolysaccharide biosynthesis protein [Sphingomonas sp.]